MSDQHLSWRIRTSTEYSHCTIKHLHANLAHNRWITATPFFDFVDVDLVLSSNCLLTEGGHLEYTSFPLIDTEFELHKEIDQPYLGTPHQPLTVVAIKAIVTREIGWKYLENLTPTSCLLENHAS